MKTVPSFEAEAAKFNGYVTNNGETVAPDDKSTLTTSTDNDLSDDERRAGVKVHGGEVRKQAAKEAPKAAAPAKVELTDEEETAALAKASEGMDEGDELTDDEKADVLATALKAKKDATKPANNERDRIKKLQRDRGRAEARAKRAEDKTADLERRLAAIEGGGKATLTGDAKPAKGVATEDKEPDPKDFEFGEVDPKFMRALTRWEVRQELAETTKKQQTTQQTADERKAAEADEARRGAFEDAAHELYDDFQEVVLDTVRLPESDPAQWPLSSTLRELILGSEQGPHVIYALASDPKEARKIGKMTAQQQQRWFFRKEAEFEAGDAGKESDEGEEGEGAGRQPTQAKSRQVTKAPPPPKRINGGSGNKQPSAATTNFADFEAMARASLRR